jgi:hypothetical protein
MLHRPECVLPAETVFHGELFERVRTRKAKDPQRLIQQQRKASWRDHKTPKNQSNLPLLESNVISKAVAKKVAAKRVVANRAAVANMKNLARLINDQLRPDINEQGHCLMSLPWFSNRFRGSMGACAHRFILCETY